MIVIFEKILELIYLICAKILLYFTTKDRSKYSYAFRYLISVR